MDPKSYDTEYKKAILKAQLKRGLPLRELLIENIKETNNIKFLEMLMRENDFEGKIEDNKMMMEELGKDDPEFLELYEKDSEGIAKLKKAIETRMEKLQEREKDKEKPNGEEKPEEEPEEEPEEKEDDQQNPEDKKDEKKKKITYHLPYDLSSDKSYMPEKGTEAFYIKNIKHNVKSCINSLYIIKTSLDLCHSPKMLVYLANNKEVFLNNIKLAATIQQMPKCDQELMGLSEDLKKQAKLIINEVTRYIEEYIEQHKKKPEDKKPEDKKPEDKKPEDKKPEDKKPEDKKPEDKKPEDKKPENKKPWELSPEERKQVNESQRRIAEQDQTMGEKPITIQNEGKAIGEE